MGYWEGHFRSFMLVLEGITVWEPPTVDCRWCTPHSSILQLCCRSWINCFKWPVTFLIDQHYYLLMWLLTEITGWFVKCTMQNSALRNSPFAICLWLFSICTEVVLSQFLKNLAEYIPILKSVIWSQSTKTYFLVPEKKIECRKIFSTPKGKTNKQMQPLVMCMDSGLQPVKWFSSKYTVYRGEEKTNRDVQLQLDVSEYGLCTAIDVFPKLQWNSC